MAAGPGDRPAVRARRWRWVATPVLLAAAFLAINAAIDRLLGQASLDTGQMIRRVADALIAALLTGCLWALAGLFGAQTRGRRIARILAVLAMLACTLPLAMCSLVADLRLT